jgi:hypothetical protein
MGFGLQASFGPLPAAFHFDPGGFGPDPAGPGIHPVKEVKGIVIFFCSLCRADTALRSRSLFMVSTPSAALGSKRATAFPLTNHQSI